MNKIKLLLLFFGIGILFAISEIVYIYNNNDELSIYAIRTAEIISSSGNIDAAIFVLETSANAIISKSDKNESILGDNPYVPTSPIGDLLKNEIKNYLNSLPNSISELRGKYDLARVFYDLSILSYKSGQPTLTPKFLSISVRINPTLSYWLVELANYHMRSNNLNKAKNVLDACSKIEAAKQHCQDYLNNNYIPNNSEEVGFLEPTVRSYYESDKY